MILVTDFGPKEPSQYQLIIKKLFNSIDIRLSTLVTTAWARIQKSTKHWSTNRCTMPEKAKIRIFLRVLGKSEKERPERGEERHKARPSFLCDRPFIYRKKIIQNMYTHIVSLNVNWKLASACQPYATECCNNAAAFAFALIRRSTIRLNTSVALSVWGDGFSGFPRRVSRLTLPLITCATWKSTLQSETRSVRARTALNSVPNAVAINGSPAAFLTYLSLNPFSPAPRQ